MAKGKASVNLDPEIAAINTVVTAIKDLDATTRLNVIEYAVRRFKIQIGASPKEDEAAAETPAVDQRLKSEPKHQEEATTPQQPAAQLKTEDGLEGISPVARKWIPRNGLDIPSLSRLFSLGIEEIDLVAKTVPGKNKKLRMRSVILLKGVAAYLGSGVARVSHEQVKETCLHYDAYDTDNFARYLKDLVAEVSGTKESGYTLTARGLTSATELVKEMLKPEK